jgi:hypothetical protein
MLIVSRVHSRINYADLPTHGECAKAEAACLRARADLIDAPLLSDMEPALLRTFDHPSYFELRANEQSAVRTIADDTSMTLSNRPLDERAGGRQADLLRGAYGLVRRQTPGWQAAAVQHAAEVLTILFAEEDALAGVLSLERRKALAVRAAAFATTAYAGVLENDHQVTPGQFLRIQAERIEQGVAR